VAVIGILCATFVALVWSVTFSAMKSNSSIKEDDA
jgi:hypothetical protein